MTTIDDSPQTRLFAVEYGGALADHLPMALSALRRMGAGAERCAAFSRTYIDAKGLRVLEDGDDELLARADLHQRISICGRANVVRAELPMLARGIGAGAFHALIRVAYGIADESDSEVAAGLIYWRRAALDLGDANGALAREPFDAAAALARAGAQLTHVGQTLGTTGLIAQRMAAIARDNAFSDAVGRPRFDETNIETVVTQIAALTVRVFAATQSFTLLHAMTATHAMRLVLPFAADRATLLHFFWRAYVAAYVSAGAPALPDEAEFARDLARVPAWDELLMKACASDDEHVIKAAFTAWTEDAIYHDPLYRVAVARYMRM